MVLYRPGHVSTRHMVDEATELVWRCRKRGTPLIIEGRVDVALAVTAEGVHLTGDDLPVAYARRILGPQAVIGVMVRSLAGAREAQRQGASYICVAPIFHTHEMACDPVGTAAVGELARQVSLPICAMGGITLDNVAQVSHTPAALIAFSTPLTSAHDIRLLSDQLDQRLQLA